MRLPNGYVLPSLTEQMTTEREIELLDVVALERDLPDRGLRRGQVGTVVEVPAPGVFEVESSDKSGRAYAMLARSKDELLLLHHEPHESTGSARTW